MNFFLKELKPIDAKDAENDLKTESIAEKLGKELEIFRALDDNTLYRRKTFGSKKDFTSEPIRLIEIKKGEFRPIKFSADGTYAILDIKNKNNDQPISQFESLIASVIASIEEPIEFDEDLKDIENSIIKKYKFIDPDINRKIDLK